MPPENVDTCETRMALPLVAEIVPALVMPPVKVGPVTAIAVRLATMVLALSIAMPWRDAVMMPLSTIAPSSVLATMLIPVPAVIVPEFEILPVNVDTELMSMAMPPAEIVP